MTLHPSSGLILHLTTRDAWLAGVRAGVYRDASLQTEGFIHASTPAQTIATANIYYRGRGDLVVVCIDPDRLTSPLRWELSMARGESFPHIYGPLNHEAVTQVLELRHGADGTFSKLPDGIDYDTYSSSVWLRAVNYDGTPHWDHPALLVEASDELVITRTGFGTVVARENGSYVSPFHTQAHYWPDRWFNVIRLQDADYRLEGYYCNIAMPMPFDGTVVRYADMQLDVRVFAAADGGLSWRVLDEDEFEVASRKYGYPQEVVDRCYAAIDELIGLVRERHSPFDA